MGKGFGDLFSQSWQEYKSNFWLFTKLFILLSFLPLTILSFSSFFINKYLLIISIPFAGLFVSVLYFFMTLSFYYIAIYKKQNVPMSSGQAFKGGASYFWKGLGLMLLMIIILIPLFILLIIPGLIFVIYWLFSLYVLMNENTGIWESMKRSKQIVKGRWWKVFGYFLLIVLINLAISIPFALPGFIYNSSTPFPSLGINDSAASISGIQGTTILSIIFNLISSLSTLIILPLVTLFFKNFYLGLKSGSNQK